MFLYKGCTRITLEIIRTISATIKYQLKKFVFSIPFFGIKAICFITVIVVMMYSTETIHCDSPSLSWEQTQQLQSSLQHAYDNEIANRLRVNARSHVVTCNDIGILWSTNGGGANFPLLDKLVSTRPEWFADRKGCTKVMHLIEHMKADPFMNTRFLMLIFINPKWVSLIRSKISISNIISHTILVKRVKSFISLMDVHNLSYIFSMVFIFSYIYYAIYIDARTIYCDAPDAFKACFESTTLNRNDLAHLSFFGITIHPFSANNLEAYFDSIMFNANDFNDSFYLPANLEIKGITFVCIYFIISLCIQSIIMYNNGYNKHTKRISLNFLIKNRSYIFSHYTSFIKKNKYAIICTFVTLTLFRIFVYYKLGVWANDTIWLIPLGIISHIWLYISIRNIFFSFFNNNWDNFGSSTYKAITFKAFFFSLTFLFFKIFFVISSLPISSENGVLSEGGVLSLADRTNVPGTSLADSTNVPDTSFSSVDFAALEASMNRLKLNIEQSTEREMQKAYDNLKEKVDLAKKRRSSVDPTFEKDLQEISYYSSLLTNKERRSLLAHAKYMQSADTKASSRILINEWASVNINNINKSRENWNIFFAKYNGLKDRLDPSERDVFIEIRKKTKNSIELQQQETIAVFKRVKEQYKITEELLDKYNKKR